VLEVFLCSLERITLSLTLCRGPNREAPAL
jgi:hypothetical protein